ncbi:MAG: acyloxyacyl hydrolase [Opitutaceae bacterium]
MSLCVHPWFFNVSGLEKEDAAMTKNLFGDTRPRPTVDFMLKQRRRFLRLLGIMVALAGGIGGVSDAEGNEKSGGILPGNWEVNFESGILWRAGHNGTPLNYVIQPQILTLKSPPVASRAIGSGTLTLRSRFSLLIEPIIRGPENHFIAVTASGMLEWWNAPQTFALFFSGGGGLGGMDSKGYEVKGAQGQDLNFTWFLYPGVRVRTSRHTNASLGIYYQHVSNRGLDKINPGIDAVGPMLSVGWRF